MGVCLGSHKLLLLVRWKHLTGLLDALLLNLLRLTAARYLRAILSASSKVEIVGLGRSDLLRSYANLCIDSLGVHTCLSCILLLVLLMLLVLLDLHLIVWINQTCL